MRKLFLDPKGPITTCDEDSCEGCVISGRLVCHYNGKQLALFLVMAAVIMLTAAYFIFSFKPILIIPWILFIISFFGFIEIRVLCAHCPHYAEPNIKTLKCWANYGSPKIWKYRPGPTSLVEKLILFSGLAIIFLPPIAILLTQRNYIFLITYIIMLIIWRFLLKAKFCRYCINFACPLNTVDQETRLEFFERNSPIRKAWETKGD